MKPINAQQTLLASVWEHVVTYPKPFLRGAYTASDNAHAKKWSGHARLNCNTIFMIANIIYKGIILKWISTDERIIIQERNGK